MSSRDCALYEIIFSTDSDKASDEDYLDCRMECSKDVIIEICSESTSAHSLDKICITFCYHLDGLDALMEEKFDNKVFATRAIHSQVVGETIEEIK